MTKIKHQQFLYETINFPDNVQFGKPNGAILTVFDEEDIGFPMKRVFTICDIEKGEIRGQHAHKETQLLIVPISGGCTVTVDAGDMKEDVKLDRPEVGIVIYPYTWHTLHSFKKDTVLMCFANTHYDEKDYIRNYEKFIAQLPLENI